LEEEKKKKEEDGKEPDEHSHVKRPNKPTSELKVRR
jgi:hypothetical protein